MFLRNESFKMQSWSCPDVNTEKPDPKGKKDLDMTHGVLITWVTTAALDPMRPWATGRALTTRKEGREHRRSVDRGLQAAGQALPAGSLSPQDTLPELWFQEADMRLSTGDRPPHLPTSGASTLCCLLQWEPSFNSRDQGKSTPKSINTFSTSSRHQGPRHPAQMTSTK